MFCKFSFSSAHLFMFDLHTEWTGGVYINIPARHILLFCLCVCMILNFLNHSLFQSRLLRRGGFFYLFFRVCLELPGKCQEDTWT